LNRGRRREKVTLFLSIRGKKIGKNVGKRKQSQKRSGKRGPLEPWGEHLEKRKNYLNRENFYRKKDTRRSEPHQRGRNHTAHATTYSPQKKEVGGVVGGGVAGERLREGSAEVQLRLGKKRNGCVSVLAILCPRGERSTAAEGEGDWHHL